MLLENNNWVQPGLPGSTQDQDAKTSYIYTLAINNGELKLKPFHSQ